VAAQVVGVDAPPDRETLHDRLPHVPVEPECVQEHDRRPALASGSHDRLVVSEAHAPDGRRSREPGIGEHAVDLADRVQGGKPA
jgi:hypothetical protein